MGQIPAAEPKPRIVIVWRGDASARARARADNNRLAPVFEALAALGAAPEPAVYDEAFEDEVRGQLMDAHGVLVWVDPISGGKDRGRLDALLRDVAASGAWVSAHPGVILKMGAKSVLYDTQGLRWCGEVHRYVSAAALSAAFPARLRTDRRRVLKQNRGNGGLGVWKVELTGEGADPPVRVHHQQGDAESEVLPLAVFMERCGDYFAGGGLIIDQPFFPRVYEGMVRCYMCEGELAGFSEHLPRGAAPERPDDPPPMTHSGEPMSATKIMYGPDEPAFAGLRARMEREWTPALLERLRIDPAMLPALWDADFVRGPKAADGADSYLLCEINVSAVSPFPPTAPAKLAAVAMRRTRAAMRGQARA
jgi:hypothetical protein